MCLPRTGWHLRWKVCLRMALATHGVLDTVCIIVFVLAVCLLKFVSVPEERPRPASPRTVGPALPFPQGQKKKAAAAGSVWAATSLWFTAITCCLSQDPETKSLKTIPNIWNLWWSFVLLLRANLFFYLNRQWLFTGSSKKCLSRSLARVYHSFVVMLGT